MTALEPTKDTLSQPDVIREAWSLAAKIAGTEFVPKSLRGSTEKVMAALLAGRELGLGPMTALAHVHIVEGRPALSAESKQALAQSAGHSIDVVETNTEKCVVIAQRAGSDRPVTVTWTMKDAAAAGLAQKDNWKKHPRRMLQARATAEAVRLVAPDATLGIPLTVEEAEDIEATAPRQAQVVRRNRPVAQPDSEPEQPAMPQPVVRAIHAAPEPPSEPPAGVSDDGEIVEAEVMDDEFDFEPSPPMQENQRRRIFAVQRAAKVSTEQLREHTLTVTNGRTDSLARDGGVTKAEGDALVKILDDIETNNRRAAEQAANADRTA